MKICKRSLALCLANRCMNPTDLRGKGVSPQSVTRALNGENLTPKTVGRIAFALGVPVESIVEKED